MDKDSRLLIKVLGIIVGMFVIGYILMVSITNSRIKQPEGSGMRLQDALILTEAAGVGNQEADSSRQNSAGSEALLLYKELEADSESILTYGQFVQLWEQMTKDWNEAQAAEIKELKKEYQKKYKENFKVLQQDWYRMYDEFLRISGMKEWITTVNVTVLGIGKEVTGSDGNTLADRQLLGEEGVYTYHSDAFSSYKYQVITAYQKEGELLTVRETVSRGLSLHNVWVMEARAQRIQTFYKSYEIWFPYEKAEVSLREQVADMDFADGRLQSVKVKKDKINGKLLSIGEGSIEIEGMGKYPYAENMKVYLLYGSLKEGGIYDLQIGYDFTDFVLEDGTICAGLITRQEAMENIRVVIKNKDYAGAYHEEVSFTSDTDFTVKYGSVDKPEEKHFSAGEIVTLDSGSEYFIGDRIYIVPSVMTGRIRLLSIERAQGNPAYRGKMEISKKKDGLIIVNEVLLEEYLYSVVPSEMPASYPLEALKAQAVCARTYAYRHMSHSGIAEYGAHVDDSAGYQVYNNIAENSMTTKAVKETSGELLYDKDSLCGSYYYSTSCGYGTDVRIWKSDSQEDLSYLQAKQIGGEEAYSGEEMTQEAVFADFIKKTQDTDYEKEEAWYRWRYEVRELKAAKILTALQKRYAVNEKLILTLNEEGSYESVPVEKLGKIKELRIVKRNDGGVADELIIEGTKNTFKVISEHNIRYVLNDGESKVVRQDGSEIASPSLLPSAYFVIETGKEDDIVVGYQLIGGGYGHGVGMSQNAAKQMAKKGFSSEDILTFFYQACEVKNVYTQSGQ